MSTRNQKSFKTPDNDVENLFGSVSEQEKNNFCDVDRKNLLPYRLWSQARSSAHSLSVKILKIRNLT